MRASILGFLAALLWTTAPAYAQELYGESDSSETMHVKGWGEFSLLYSDYPSFQYQDQRIRRNQRDSRLVADIEQFSLEIGQNLGSDWGYSLEIDFNHSGVSVEDLPNYLGPFAEPHGTHGTPGAVQLTQFYLWKELTSQWSLQGGRVPVAFGLSSDVTPGDYLSAYPFEAESNLVPPNWSELGLALFFQEGRFESTSQIVSGLDSSAFNSRRFVAQGQQRYGSANITKPAFVQRLDVRFHKFLVGASIYYSDTARNRPIYDMAKGCPKAEGNSVAPCGYVYAPLTMYDYHVSYEGSRLTARAMYLIGLLKNAEDINKANITDTTNLPDYYYPVANRAYGSMVEVGYKFFVQNSDAWEAFLRLEHYDTMSRPAAANEGGPHFERKLGELGLAYLTQSFFAKLSYQYRAYGSRDLFLNRTVAMTTGFYF